MSAMTCYEWLVDLHKICNFQTKEGKKVGRASNSELRRWISNKALMVDGIRVGVDDEFPTSPSSVVLFPKNTEHRVTLW